MDNCLQDIRFAARQMRKAPAFTAVAVLSLALGIGANTAIFTLIESTLLRPIPVKHPGRLRLLSWQHRAHGWVAPSIASVSPTFGWNYEQRETADGGLLHTAFSPPLYQEFLRDNTVFSSLFGFKEIGRLTAVVDGSAEPVNAFLVSGDFYRGMEVTPAIGRPIGPQDDVPTAEGQVALISYQYWTRRFARSRSVVGKRITLNDVPVTIIGVNPESFTGIQPGAHFEIWAPLHLPPAIYGASPLDNPGSWSIPMMGRLKPNVSDTQAQSALDAIFQARLDLDYPGIPAQKRPWFLLQPGNRGLDYLTEHYQQPFRALLALAGLVLLIACANGANLLLARSAVRQREVSLRLALGAWRGRIIRQLLTEGLLLASLAGVTGLVFGYWTRNSIPALLATPWRGNPFDTAFDPKVLLVAIGLTFATGILFSLAPVWQLRRVEGNEALKEGSRGTASLSKLRIGRLLVILQVAISVLLLAGIWSSLRTFTNLRETALGLKPEGVLLFRLEPPRVRYPAERMATLLTQLQGRLGAIPGVQSAAFSGDGGGAWVARRNQQPELIFANYAPSIGVGSRFFETMGIPILEGRAIDPQDSINALRAAVVNQEFARHFFPNENPIGQTFTGLNPFPGQTYATRALYQIVGVCAGWRVDRLRDPIRQSFYPSLLQAPAPGSANFEVKVAGGGPEAMRQAVKQVRQVVRAMDPDLAVLDIRTQVQQIEDSLSQERLLAALALVFGTLALLLASIGIYGVMAYGVTRRTSEIGIRVALGARPAGVAWMVLRETLALAAAGLALGVPAVWALGPILNHALAPPFREGLAYGIKPTDPFVTLVAVFVLIAAAFLAGYLPARRAAPVDPMTALRHE
jgi:predicted permease